jgi:ubiquinone/menaquinone biosynthesis C-methylase UbiE
MDADLQRRIQRYGWDKAANHYGHYWLKQLEPAQSTLMEEMSLTPGETVVDIACGSGDFTFAIAEKVGPDGRVLANDISEEMVALAARTAADKGIHHITFDRMDAEELAVDDAVADVVICSRGLMYVPNAQKAINEMYRVTKPGGRAGAVVWGQRNRCGWADIFPIVERRVKSDVCPLFFQLGTGQFMENQFRQAGFKNLRTRRIDTLLKYENGDDACGAAFVGGPVALAYSRFDEKTRTESFSDYLESIAPFKDGDGYAIPGEFVVTVGVKD